MFSQKLDSSPDGAVRKLGAMFISFVSHVFVLALLVGLSLVVSEVVLVEADGPGVSRLTFGPSPGDPKQPAPGDLRSPHFGVVEIDPNASSKIHLEELKRGDVTESEPVLAPIGVIPKGFKVWDGPCGCRPRPYEPFNPNPSSRKLPVVERSSWLREAVLVKRVDPEYPVFAKRAGIQGAVVVHATIDRDGAVTAISVVSGPNQLRGAAVDAIRQWRYQPYVLNGLAVEIETTITVNFVLPDLRDYNSTTETRRHGDTEERYGKSEVKIKG